MKQTPTYSMPASGVNAKTIIRNANLSTRTVNCLLNAGCRNVGDITKFKFCELQMIPNLGGVTLLEILGLLEAAKLDLVESGVARKDPHIAIMDSLYIAGGKFEGGSFFPHMVTIKSCLGSKPPTERVYILQVEQK